MSFVLPNLPVQKWLLPLVKGIWNDEENKPASNSAAKRWIQKGAVHINGERVSLDEIINFPVFSIIVFPKSDKRRVTLL